MPFAEASAVVPLSASEAFALAHEVGDARAEWDPEVAECRFIRGSSEDGQDVFRFVKTPRGRRMILRTQTWFPPVSSSSVMVKGPAWMREYGEGWRVRELEDGTSKVTLKITLRLPSPGQRAVGAITEGTLQDIADRRMRGYAAAAAGRAQV